MLFIIKFVEPTPVFWQVLLLFVHFLSGGMAKNGTFDFFFKRMKYLLYGCLMVENHEIKSNFCKC